MRPKIFAQLFLNKRSFSSLKSSNIILIRHAESVFNALCHKYPQEQIYGKEAQQQFHFNPEILDCSLTQIGFKSANSKKIINFFQNKSPENTIFFVSPMLRTLQTTKSILNSVGKDFQVVVLPQLTEILSKICDFSSGIKNKKYQFSQFDFEYFDQWVKQKGQNVNQQNWQDHFLDINIRQNLGTETDAQKRYIQILRNSFPKQVENIQKCKKRSIQGAKKILEISQKLNRKNSIVVSHNRILKNIQKFIEGKDPKDYDNLEIRKFKISQSIKQIFIKDNFHIGQ